MTNKQKRIQHLAEQLALGLYLSDWTRSKSYAQVLSNQSTSIVWTPFDDYTWEYVVDCIENTKTSLLNYAGDIMEVMK